MEPTPVSDTKGQINKDGTLKIDSSGFIKEFYDAFGVKNDTPKETPTISTQENQPLNSQPSDSKIQEIPLTQKYATSDPGA